MRVGSLIGLANSLGKLTVSLRVSTDSRKVDVRLPAKGNSISHDARPVHQIITMMKWIRTSRSSIKEPSLQYAWNASIIDSGLVGSKDFYPGGGTTRAEDAKRTPTQSHISPSILVYEDKPLALSQSSWACQFGVARLFSTLTLAGV